VTLLTVSLGRIAALARRARSGTRSKALPLEPMHTLRISVDDRPGVDLLPLRDAAMLQPRVRLLGRLEAMEAAGRVLRWVRIVAPPRVPEPEVFALVTRALDAWDGDVDELSVPNRLVCTGLQLLSALGYALELSACVSCGRACEAGRSALLDPAGGGIRCRSCGGGPHLLRPDLREKLVRASTSEAVALTEREATEVLRWVEEALLAHAGASS
jgi:DNA repair protein RecO (recombination protein O)